MPYKNIVFAKLDKRLFSDHRWYMMSEPAQLNYIRFILFAAETYNKIPKNLTALRKGFKTDQNEKTIESTIQEIKANFEKFKENRHYYYFEGFDEKTNYISIKEKRGKTQGVPKEGTDKEEDKEEDKEKEGKKKRTNIPSLKDLSQYCNQRNNGVDPQRFHDFYQSKGWYVGKNKMKDWRAAVRTWEKKSGKKKIRYV